MDHPKGLKQFKKFLNQYALIYLSCIMLSGGLIYRYQFGDKPFEQILFYARSPMQGANWQPLFLNALLIFLMSLAMFYLFSTILNIRNIHDLGKKIQRLILVASFISLLLMMDVMQYLYYQIFPSQALEEFYQDPAEVEMIFPEKKRNLIYIFLESMESTFSDKRLGGSVEGNLIPRLTARALDPKNVHFSDEEMIGGARGLASIGFTTGGMVAQTSGLPLKVDLIENSREETRFLPGAMTLGDVLKKEGYHLELLMGSDASFGGRRHYFTDHGNYQIDDLFTAREKGLIPDDYFVFWGYEDDKLFRFAKRRLNELGKSSQPFCYTMLTVDSHFPDGNPDPAMPMPYEESYANAIHQSDMRLDQFLNWVTEQDFFENTTVILSGDHLSMAEPFFRSLEQPRRRIYTLIMNPMAHPEKSRTQNRDFTVLDFFPTTLSALGVAMDHAQLGYGVDLYSKEKTLLEKMGEKELELMLRFRSQFYKEKLKEEP